MQRVDMSRMQLPISRTFLLQQTLPFLHAPHALVMPCVSLSGCAGLALKPPTHFAVLHKRTLHQQQYRIRSVTVPKAVAQLTPPQLGFQHLGLSHDLCRALEDQNIRDPTEIQTVAIPNVLRRKDTLIASHTGSGKTLAYYLPLIQMLRNEEQRSAVSTRPKRPRALVLGPTRELTDQILQVGKTLAHFAKFRSTCINGGGEWKRQKDALEQPVDVVVATPKRLLQHCQKGNVYLGDVRMVVLDEADTMFDEGFGPEVQQIVQAVRSKAEPAKCVLVAATMSKQVTKLVSKEFPDMIRSATSSFHKGVAGAQHTFVPVPPADNKLHLLSQTIAQDVSKGQRVMVFCNTLASCRAVDHFLAEAGLYTRCYHGDVPLDQRKQAILDFAADRESHVDQPVLVCTDLAARGLDIPGRVHHVVNFDFPLNPVDYIHRSGRTARAGNRGRISSLVMKGDRVLAERIEDALKQGRSLDELSASKTVLPPNMRPKEETRERQRLERKAEQMARKGVRGEARVQMSKKGLPPIEALKGKLRGSAAVAAAKKERAIKAAAREKAAATGNKSAGAGRRKVGSRAVGGTSRSQLHTSGQGFASGRQRSGMAVEGPAPGSRVFGGQGFRGKRLGGMSRNALPCRQGVTAAAGERDRQQHSRKRRRNPPRNK